MMGYKPLVLVGEIIVSTASTSIQSQETEFFQPPCEGGKDKGPLRIPPCQGGQLGFFLIVVTLEAVYLLF